MRPFQRSMRATLLLLGLTALTAACNDDDGTGPQVQETTFEVRVENVGTVFDYTDSGVFTTPLGAAGAGPATPGNAFEFTFDAGPASRLFFATMFGQSNDLFYGPDGDGITLYDAGGDPMSGDVTGQVYLWNAGTEIDQEPGLGPDQAPRQAGADMGAPDPNPNVRRSANGFGNLPAVEDAIRVTLTHLGGTRFRLLLQNIAAADALMTSDGGTAPVVLSPGVWIVSNAPDALFTEGQPDRGMGLERIAEDGSPTDLHASAANRTGLTSPISPGVYAVHRGSSVLFTAGSSDRGEGLERLAEEGNAAPLGATLAARSDLVATGGFDTPVDASEAGPAFPGDAYVFTITAMPGDRLSFASMLGQSNDLFFAPADAGMALFQPDGSPHDGDVTGMVLLWDAGTEINEYPGVGPNQAPRQSAADTGPDENGIVRQVNDGYSYPSVPQMIRVTLTPMTS